MFVSPEQEPEARSGPPSEDATGLTPPTALPRVGWRAGIDLNPLDVTSADDRAWLEALIWWISAEDPAVVPFPDLPPPPPDGLHKNVLALDGKPLAWTESHGRSLSWFGS